MRVIVPATMGMSVPVSLSVFVTGFVHSPVFYVRPCHSRLLRGPLLDG